MRHAFGIPVLTKNHFGKNQSYEVLTPTDDINMQNIFFHLLHIFIS